MNIVDLVETIRILEYVFNMYIMAGLILQENGDSVENEELQMNVIEDEESENEEDDGRGRFFSLPIAALL